MHLKICFAKKLAILFTGEYVNIVLDNVLVMKWLKAMTLNKDGDNHCWTIPPTPVSLLVLCTTTQVLTSSFNH